jgi:hypothetical protein
VSFQKKVSRQRQQASMKKVTIARPHTSQRSDTGLLTCVDIDYPFWKMNIQPPLSFFGMDKHNTSLKKSAEEA